MGSGGRGGVGSGGPNLLTINPSFELDDLQGPTRGSAATICRGSPVQAEVTHEEMAARTIGPRLAPHLRVYWNFESGQGSQNVTDASGRGNDGAIKVGTSTPPAGQSAGVARACRRN